MLMNYMLELFLLALKLQADFRPERIIIFSDINSTRLTNSKPDIYKHF